MVQDFGSGLSVDELIGLPAWHIYHLRLPPNEIFEAAHRAAGIMIKAGCESFVLAELWEDGHSVWHSMNNGQPVVVTPTGQLIRNRS